MFGNRFLELPKEASGYELDPAKSFFSVVVPTGTNQTNLILNPSGETNLTGHLVALAGTLSQDVTVQKFGVYGIKLVPTANTEDGFEYTNTTSMVLASGTLYFFSVWFKGEANKSYQLIVDKVGPVRMVTYHFKGTGEWQRPYCAFTATGSVQHYFYVLKDGNTSLAPLWTDGWQVEANYLTTYIDGDQLGFVHGRADYYWTGTPHASTSVRLGQCRAGGKVIAFSQLGFRLLAAGGLGLGGLVHQLQPLALGGSAYQGTVISDRQFSLIGQIAGESLEQLQRRRQALLELFSSWTVTPPQPVRLLYEPNDGCGNSAGRQLEIDCLFEEGLAGNLDNLYQERLALVFRQYLPFVGREIGNSGLALASTSHLADVGYILQRSPTGQWSKMGAGANLDGFYAMVRMPNGDIIAGGAFGNVGPANTSRIARWDGSAWNAMGTGANGAVYALAVGPDGSLYAGGAFTSMSGVAGTRGIARWDGANWNALAAAGIDAGGTAVYALAFDTGGNLWVGGLFSTLNAVANTLNLGLWNGTAYVALGTGADGEVDCLAVNSLSGSLISMYIGGLFTHLNGNDANHIAVTAYGGSFLVVAMGSGTAGATPGVKALLTLPNGDLIVGGTFTSAGGVGTTEGIALWKGETWQPLGTGLSTGAYVYALAYDPVTKKVLVAGDVFTSAGGISVPDHIAIWNGSQWEPIDEYAEDPGWWYGALLATPTGAWYVGWNGAVDNDAIVAGLTTITNLGSAPAGLKATIVGPGRLFHLINLTTGKGIYFNYTLLTGETAVLDMTDPSQITFTSSMFGNVLNRISGGSRPAEFQLLPGANILLLAYFPVGISLGSVSVTWRNVYHSIDGAIPTRLLP